MDATRPAETRMLPEARSSSRPPAFVVAGLAVASVGLILFVRSMVQPTFWYDLGPASLGAVVALFGVVAIVARPLEGIRFASVLAPAVVALAAGLPWSAYESGRGPWLGASGVERGPRGSIVVAAAVSVFALSVVGWRASRRRPRASARLALASIVALAAIAVVLVLDAVEIAGGERGWTSFGWDLAAAGTAVATACCVRLGRSRDAGPMPRVDERQGTALAAIGSMAGALSIPSAALPWFSKPDGSLEWTVSGTRYGPPSLLMPLGLVASSLLLVAWASTRVVIRRWTAVAAAVVLGSAAFVAGRVLVVHPAYLVRAYGSVLGVALPLVALACAGTVAVRARARRGANPVAG